MSMTNKIWILVNPGPGSFENKWLITKWFKKISSYFTKLYTLWRQKNKEKVYQIMPEDFTDTYHKFQPCFHCFQYSIKADSISCGASMILALALAFDFVWACFLGVKATDFGDFLKTNLGSFITEHWRNIRTKINGVI